MRISELARETGLTVDTIRYYEKRGLLDETHMSRGANRYRDYNDKAVNRLRLVRRAQKLGLTLTEIANFIQEWEEKSLDKADIRAFFQDKIAMVDARMAELQAMRAYLCEKLDEID